MPPRPQLGNQPVGADRVTGQGLGIDRVRQAHLGELGQRAHEVARLGAGMDGEQPAQRVPEFGLLTHQQFEPACTLVHGQRQRFIEQRADDGPARRQCVQGDHGLRFTRRA